MDVCLARFNPAVEGLVAGFLKVCRKLAMGGENPLGRTLSTQFLRLILVAGLPPILHPKSGGRGDGPPNRSAARNSCFHDPYDYRLRFRCVGAAKKGSAARWGVPQGIVYAWIITMPAPGLIAAITYFAAGMFG